MKKNIGVLAYHGDVVEHIQAATKALKNLNITAQVTPVRTKEDLATINCLIIPGGESTVFSTLAKREKIFEDLKKIKYIFGTCAGAILLAKTLRHKAKDQETLNLMDITIDRNAYGRQTNSFEKQISTKLGKIHAVFIRAPKIQKIGRNVLILAKNDNEIIACEERVGGNYYLATCFHPELTTTKFHEYFLKKCFEK